MDDHYLLNAPLNLRDDIPTRKLEFSSPLPRLNRVCPSHLESFERKTFGAQLTNSSFPFSKFEESANELTVQFDIFGRPLKESSESVLLSTNHSSNNKFDDHFLSSTKSNEISVFKYGYEGSNIEEEKEEEEIKEWEVDKENTDPMGNLITPSKPKRTSVHGASQSSRRNNSGRSPLQDITPSIGTKKSPSSQFNHLSAEVNIIF